MKKIIVEISLKGDLRLLKSMYDSLVPDNVNIPEGMEIMMEMDGSLKIVISGDEKLKIDTLISTLDEILEACSMIEKAMEGIKDVGFKIRKK